MLADRAVVLRGGRIVEKGPPRELIRPGPVFRRLFGVEAADAAAVVHEAGR